MSGGKNDYKYEKIVDGPSSGLLRLVPKGPRSTSAPVAGTKAQPWLEIEARRAPSMPPLVGPPKMAQLPNSGPIAEAKAQPWFEIEARRAPPGPVQMPKPAPKPAPVAEARRAPFLPLVPPPQKPIAAPRVAAQPRLMPVAKPVSAPIVTKAKDVEITLDPDILHSVFPRSKGKRRSAKNRYVPRLDPPKMR